MNLNPRIGIGVLIFDPQKRILLGRRIGSHGECMWGPPGGHLEFGETFEDCAIREVIEETGIVIQNPTFLGMTNDVFTSEQKHYISIFMGTMFPLNQTIQNCEPHKTEEWEWFSLEALPEPLFSPMHRFFANNGYGIIDLNLRF